MRFGRGRNTSLSGNFVLVLEASAQTSPFLDQQTVIPIAIPLTYMENTTIMIVADSVESSDAILFLLLDAEMVRDFLHTYSNRSLEGSYYLLDSGNLIADASRTNTKLQDTDKTE